MQKDGVHGVAVVVGIQPEGKMKKHREKKVIICSVIKTRCKHISTPLEYTNNNPDEANFFLTPTQEATTIKEIQDQGEENHKDNVADDPTFTLETVDKVDKEAEDINSGEDVEDTLPPQDQGSDDPEILTENLRQTQAPCTGRFVVADFLVRGRDSAWGVETYLMGSRRCWRLRLRL